VLKKAGIVVAAAAAGLLAVSPLAFAGDKGKATDDVSAIINDDDNVNNIDQQRNQVGLVNVNDNEINVPVQVACNQILNNLDVVASVLGIAGGAATGGADTNSGTADCEQTNSSGGAILQTIG